MCGITLLRCYTSRVENGHTVPNLETLLKYPRALEVPLYRLFYEGNEPAEPPRLPRTSKAEWGATGKESAELHKFARLLSRLKQQDRVILLGLAQRMANRSVRALTRNRWLPDNTALIVFLDEDVGVHARIVYCNPLHNAFAVGLQFSTAIDLWISPNSPAI